MSESPHSLLRQWIVLGLYAVLLTPLVFWQDLDFFFDSTKTFFVMVLSELLLVGYLWLAYRYPAWRPRRDLVSKAFLALLLAIVLVSAFGVDPFVSFWASTERINGVLWWLHLGALYLVLANILRTSQDWNRFFVVQIEVGLIVGVIFLLTQMDPTFLVDSKGGATTGNSTFLGAYLLFSVFFALMLWAGGHAVWMRRFGLICAAVFALLIFATSAQAAKGALLGAVPTAVGLWLIFSDKRARVKKWLGAGILAALTATFVYATSTLFTAGSFFNKLFLSYTGGARLEVWKIAWAAFLDRPLFGWGIENFPYAFWAHYSSCFGSPGCGGEYWFDRAHNKVLDLLVEGGLVLFLAYAAVFGAAGWAFWRAYKARRVSRATVVLFFTFLIAYAVHNFFEFDVAVTYVFFIVMMASASAQSAHEPSPHTTPRRWWILLPILATLALPFGLYHSVVLPVRTNQSHQVVEAKKMPERLAAYEKMAFGSPIGIDYRRVFLAGETVKLFFGLSLDKRERLAPSLRREFGMAIAGLEESVARAPNYLRGFDLLGLLYQIEGRYDDEGSFAKAEDVLRKSFALNPRHQQAYWALAAVLLDVGEHEEAFDLLDQAIALNEEVEDSHYKKLVAIKLTQPSDVFEREAAVLAERFPALRSQIDKLLALPPDADMGWLYTIFY